VEAEGMSDTTNQSPHGKDETDRPSPKPAAGLPRWLFRLLVLIGGVLGLAAGLGEHLLFSSGLPLRNGGDSTNPNDFLGPPIRAGFEGLLAGLIAAVLFASLLNAILARKKR
jgi:hypothetical protein